MRRHLDRLQAQLDFAPVVRPVPGLAELLGLRPVPWQVLAFEVEVDADELAPGLAVVQRIHQCLVGQRVPLLQEVHAQHSQLSDGRPTYLAALGTVRLDERVDFTAATLSPKVSAPYLPADDLYQPIP